MGGCPTRETPRVPFLQWEPARPPPSAPPPSTPRSARRYSPCRRGAWHLPVAGGQSLDRSLFLWNLLRIKSSEYVLLAGMDFCLPLECRPPREDERQRQHRWHGSGKNRGNGNLSGAACREASKGADDAITTVLSRKESLIATRRAFCAQAKCEDRSCP